MARDSKYFRLGLFVLTGLLLMAGLAIAFGLGTLFTETVPAESYFNESVEGLEQGSPVKYRGVNIGSVSEIGFLIDAYPDTRGPAERYVLVRMDIRQHVAKTLTAEEVGRNLNERIARGLRIRLTTQGLTGVAYLEIDYLDPARNPLLPTDWQPETLYIPSAPSTYSRLEGAIENISTTLDEIARIDFGGLVNSINTVMTTLDQALKEADVGSLGELLAQNLTELRTTIRQANKLISAPETSAIITDASKTMASMRRMSEGAEQDVLTLASNLRQSSERMGQVTEDLHQLLVDPDLKRGLSQFPEVMDNILATTSDFSRTAQRLSGVAGNISDLTLSQRQNLEAVLGNLNTLMDNLNALVEDLNQNPSRALFGQPPAQVQSPFENR
ncbi:ABC-type transport system involved in resistance to organic solvent, periplasmic component [Desulfocurvibacter africanus PCS]|uniref:ABC-type transport system involved in resistance to organic solvent, periplasmic component n=1 Tax=Desulfocurvibacter africanus PCS TaxID=1262666 RepID=M5PW29_DESAF|nr:MlaD family protein [Desulfocurvibacter africanus]EMG38512.1 ABC-type transport system involved in resistance to organic solvent, periplasmic component [Desulfocurvibacter africanus PCS]